MFNYFARMREAGCFWSWIACHAVNEVLMNDIRREWGMLDERIREVIDWPIQSTASAHSKVITTAPLMLTDERGEGQ